MNVTKHWVEYCSGNTRDATEDDWNHFVFETFLAWRQRQLELDPNSSQSSEKSRTDYAAEHCNFTQFIEGADTYRELVDLEQRRHNP